MVLTSETQDGQVAVANLTTHDPERRRLCDDRCVLIRPGEHPYPSHNSCVFYRDAFLTSVAILRAGVENRTYRVGDPLSFELLDRVRQGAVDSRLTAATVKPESTDRSLRGRDAGLPESLAGVAGVCRAVPSEEPSLSVARGR